MNMPFRSPAKSFAADPPDTPYRRAAQEWDARMGGLPKPATVKRYRELWAVKDAGDLWELADRASAIKRLEKKHPALIHHLQIPLTPPVSEKTASEADVKNAKPLDPPKFSLN